MTMEVYCDETRPDLFTSKHPQATYLMIGGLWLPAELRSDIKNKIAVLRDKHGVHGEIKWGKISPSRQVFYEDLVDIFIDFGPELRFRCIAVDRHKFDAEKADNDAELGFFKFYYQLLHHWIDAGESYVIFCDGKTTAGAKRHGVLKACLQNANKTSNILNVLPQTSHQSALMQLCDVLLGAASAKINQIATSSPAKLAVIQKIESRLGHAIMPTAWNERKFNVFKIELRGN